MHTNEKRTYEICTNKGLGVIWDVIKYYYSQIANSSGIGIATKFSLATASFCGISVQTQFLLEQLNL